MTRKSVAAFIASGEVQKMEWLAFVRGFEVARNAAAKVADNRAHGTDDEVMAAKDIRDTIRALTPEGK